MRLAGLAPGALLAVAGFGAPQPGTHVEVGGGPGAYHYSGGCDGPHNYANFVALQARVHHLEPTGLVLTAEAAGQRDDVVRSEGGNVSELARRDTFYVAALRIGFEGRYVGFEVGPGVMRGGINESRHTPEISLVPSLKVWGGRYGLVHGWAAVLADQTLPTNRVFGFGVGHASPGVRASVGLAGSGGVDSTFIVDADFAVGRTGLWLGAGGQFTDNKDTWGLLGRVGFFFGGTGAAPPWQAPEEAPGIEPGPPAEPPLPQPVVIPAPAPAPDAAQAPSVDVDGVEVDAGA